MTNQHLNGNGHHAGTWASNEVAEPSRAEIGSESSKYPAHGRREFFDCAVAELERNGRLLRAPDGRLLYFSNEEKKLIDLNYRHFGIIVARRLGLDPANTTIKAIAGYASVVAEQRPTTAIHTLSAYNEKEATLAVSDGGDGIWLHERRGDWRYISNGKDGLYFLTDPEAELWVPEFRKNNHSALRSAEWDWWFTNFRFASSRGLNHYDYRAMLSYLIQYFFFRKGAARVSCRSSWVRRGPANQPCSPCSASYSSATFRNLWCWKPAALFGQRHLSNHLRP